MINICVFSCIAKNDFKSVKMTLSKYRLGFTNYMWLYFGETESMLLYFWSTTVSLLCTLAPLLRADTAADSTRANNSQTLLLAQVYKPLVKTC